MDGLTESNVYPRHFLAAKRPRALTEPLHVIYPGICSLAWVESSCSAPTWDPADGVMNGRLITARRC